MDKHAMVIRADARAMGAITALTVGGTRRNARTTQRRSPCICYASRDDYDQGIVSRVIHDTRTVTRNPASRASNAPIRPHRTMAGDLPALNCD